MANGGPTKISDEDIVTFQKIMNAKGPEQQALMKALPPTKKRDLLAYIQLEKSKRKIDRLESEVAVLDARAAALGRQDRAILVQKSKAFAQSLDSIVKPTEVLTTGGQKLKH